MMVVLGGFPCLPNESAHQLQALYKLVPT